MDQVVCREKYGSESLRKSYIRGHGDQLRAVDSSRGFNSASSFFRVSREVDFHSVQCHAHGYDDTGVTRCHGLS